MILLAMDTSTLVGSVALFKDNVLLAEERSRDQRSHSENINPFIQSCLKKAQVELQDVDAYAVGIGPGSFTGIRVALNAAKSLAYTFNKPLVGVDSLTALAYPIKDQPVISMINAYKNMVYLNIFDKNQAPMSEPKAIPVRELSKHIPPGIFRVVGDGWTAYHEFFPEALCQQMTRNSEDSDYPLACYIGPLGLKILKSNSTFDWKSILPLYIRASEAEENRKGILLSPLK